MRLRFLLLAVFLLLQNCKPGEKEVTIDLSDINQINGTAKVDPPVYFQNMFGVNGFEWDFFLDPAKSNGNMVISEPRMEIIKSFGGFRHYMDWDKLEATPGNYTFNPTHNGSWNYDLMYERCKTENIPLVACLKSCPDWLVKTYPEGERDAENVPAPYGSDLEKPASYILQAKAAFQFAARYGSNKNLDTSFIKVNPKPRWTGDAINQKKIGLNLVHYMECDNERDKDWKGKRAYQTPQQYAANLSAFYDGDKGKLGKNVGVKTADPNMVVVMGGIASADVNYVQQMIEWCKKYRGFKANGSIDLCFDVINYHYYAHNEVGKYSLTNKRGIAPELSAAAKKADEFIKLAHQTNPVLPVWITETGYDINAESPQSALAIGQKTTEDTQADWLLRTSLLYARHGVGKVFFYMLDDVDKNSTVQYASSGLADGNSRRKSASYLLQTKNLMGKFHYIKTFKNDVLVDVYASGNKKIYVLTVPDEKGRTVICHFKLPHIKKAIIYNLLPDASFMHQKMVPVVKGELTITASETPVFVAVD